MKLPELEHLRAATKSRKMKEGSSDEPVLPDVHGDAARSLLVGLVEDPGEGERLLANLKTKSKSVGVWPGSNILSGVLFLCHRLPPFSPTSKKRDADYDYLKYWITVKGCPSLTQCQLLFRP